VEQSIIKIKEEKGDSKITQRYLCKDTPRTKDRANTEERRKAVVKWVQTKASLCWVHIVTLEPMVKGLPW
jgi:hypothetical protein